MDSNLQLEMNKMIITKRDADLLNKVDTFLRIYIFCLLLSLLHYYYVCTVDSHCLECQGNL